MTHQQHPGQQQGQHPGPHPGQHPGHYPQVPGNLPGPGIGEHIGRLSAFNKVNVSPKEQAALLKSGVPEPAVQRLLTWRRSALIFVLPLLIVAVALSLLDAYQEVSGEGLLAEYSTTLGIVCTWLPPLTMLFLPIGAVAAIVWWTGARKSTSILIGTWGIATIMPLVTALVPMEWRWEIDRMGEDDARENNLSLLEMLGYSPSEAEEFLQSPDVQADLQADIETMTTANGLSMAMLSAVNFTIILMPVIIGLVNGVLRGALRTKITFPSTIVPGWFVVIAAPFFTLVLCTMFAIVSPILGSGIASIGILLVAVAPLTILFFVKKITRPMSRAEAAPVSFRATVLSLSVSLVGLILLGYYLVTGEVYGISVLGSTDAVNDEESLFSYLNLGQSAVGLIARFQFTMVIMVFLFTRLAYREGYELAVMPKATRQEHISDMRELQRFATGIPFQPSAPAQTSAPAQPGTPAQPGAPAQPDSQRSSDTPTTPPSNPAPRGSYGWLPQDQSQPSGPAHPPASPEDNGRSNH